MAGRRLAAGIIRVHRSWDRHTGPIAPKSRAGTRKVPLSQPLRIHLAKHRLAHHHPHSELVFARANGQPFTQAVTNRARKAWNHAHLQPIGLHECRHTYASYMIAAGINAKALSTYMGHSSITTTLDRYGHLMPGNEHQAAAMLTTYLNHKPNHPRTPASRRCFAVTERDPERPWIVVGSEHRTITLEDGAGFFTWVAERWPAPR